MLNKFIWSLMTKHPQESHKILWSGAKLPCPHLKYDSYCATCVPGFQHLIQWSSKYTGYSSLLSLSAKQYLYITSMSGCIMNGSYLEANHLKPPGWGSNWQPLLTAPVIRTKSANNYTRIPKNWPKVLTGQILIHFLGGYK